MSNEEAIKILKEVREEVLAKETELSKQVFENLGIKAIDLAIEALEQTKLNSSYNSVKTELKSSEDCISREKAVYVASGYCAPQNIADELRRLPSVKPTRPHKGVWIPIYLNDIEWGYKCSNCKETWLNEYNYCPECGCKMEVDDEEN